MRIAGNGDYLHVVMDAPQVFDQVNAVRIGQDHIGNHQARRQRQIRLKAAAALVADAVLCPALVSMNSIAVASAALSSITRIEAPAKETNPQIKAELFQVVEEHERSAIEIIKKDRLGKPTPNAGLSECLF